MSWKCRGCGRTGRLSPNQIDEIYKNYNYIERCGNCCEPHDWYNDDLEIGHEKLIVVNTDDQRLWFPAITW